VHSSGRLTVELARRDPRDGPVQVALVLDVVEAHTIDAHARLRGAISGSPEASAVGTHQRLPSAILVLLPALRGAAHALRLVQAEQTAVDLARDAVGAEQIVEEPLLAQARHAGVEDAVVEGAEIARLVHGDKQILQLERGQVEVAVPRLASCGARVVWLLRVPVHVPPVCNAS